MMSAKINGLEAGAQKLGVRMRHFMWVGNRKPLPIGDDVAGATLTCRHDTFNSTGIKLQPRHSSKLRRSIMELELVLVLHHAAI